MHITTMLDIVQFPFFQRALAVGILMAVTAAMIGVFVVMRRLAFFSDAVAHMSLTGVALALAAGINPFVGAVSLSVIAALVIERVARKSPLTIDTIIGVFFSVALAVGVLVISALPGYRGELFQYLFGDILAVRGMDVIVAFGLFVITSTLLFWNFSRITRIAFHEDIAIVDKISVARLNALFMVLLALTVAMGIRVVGSILMGALIILPAATAKYLGRSFRQFVVLTLVLSVVATVLGLLASAALSLPSGPMIVAVAGVGFAFAALRAILTSK